MDVVLYDDADILIRNKEVAALDDKGLLMFNKMRPYKIQVRLVVAAAAAILLL